MSIAGTYRESGDAMVLSSSAPRSPREVALDHTPVLGPLCGDVPWRGATRWV
jgi:hypothetical protein